MSNPRCTPSTGDGSTSPWLEEASTPHPAGLVTRTLLIPWPCRDCYSGSLYALPPESCRREVFCRHCTAATCLFGGTPAERRGHRAPRHWSMPDDNRLSLYIEALRLYTSLLDRHRTCWHCAGLRLLQGRERRYVCPHNLRLVAEGPGGRGLPSLSGSQARLVTALEGCQGEHFAARSAPIPLLLATRWRDMVTGMDLRGRCDHCLHLRSLMVAGRERYVCVFEAGRQAPELAWRLARSWRVLQGRGSDGVWCRGAEWRLRVGTILPLTLTAATV